MQALWMVAAAVMFAAMGVCVKFASSHYSPLEIVYYRGTIGLVVIWLITRQRGVSLHTKVPMMRLKRNVAGVIALCAWFYAFAHLPLATAMTLNYT